MVDPTSYYRFWEAMEVELQAGFLPVEMAKRTTTESFAVPIFAAACSRDLESAARRLADYKPLVSPVKLTTSSTPSGLTITYDWGALDPPPAVLVWSDLLFWVAIARLATRTHIEPTKVVGPRVDAVDEIADYTGAKPGFGLTTSISFDRPSATAPFLTANPEMLKAFEPSLRARLVDLDQEATYSDRVHVALLELLPGGESSIDDVAHHLATSTRTLQRRLHQESNTFQRILATTREQLAQHYLQDQHLPTAQIAFLLGYEDPTSFQRAYREWTGTTPSRARRR